KDCLPRRIVDDREVPTVSTVLKNSFVPGRFTMRLRRWSAMSGGLAACLTVGLLIGAGNMRAQQDEAKPNGTPTESKRAQEFVAAFNRGDAKACASFWAPDGNYVAPDGVEVKGRDALEKMYENLFANVKGAKLAISVSSGRSPTPDVTIEEGTSELKTAEGGP